jgi:hypothetical protein
MRNRTSENVLTVMQEPFLILKDVKLLFTDNMASVVLDSFLGATPRLGWHSISRITKTPSIRHSLSPSSTSYTRVDSLLRPRSIREIRRLPHRLTLPFPLSLTIFSLQLILYTPQLAQFISRSMHTIKHIWPFPIALSGLLHEVLPFDSYFSRSRALFRLWLIALRLGLCDAKTEPTSCRAFRFLVDR